MSRKIIQITPNTTGTLAEYNLHDGQGQSPWTEYRDIICWALVEDGGFFNVYGMCTGFEGDIDFADKVEERHHRLEYISLLDAKAIGVR
jgi:hypothetical protein